MADTIDELNDAVHSAVEAAFNAGADEDAILEVLVTITIAFAMSCDRYDRLQEIAEPLLSHAKQDNAAFANLIKKPPRGSA